MKNKHIVIVIPVLLIMVFALLGWRLFYLQRYRGMDSYQNSNRQQHAVISEKPQRGVILDRCGRILAASNKIPTVFADHRTITDVKEAAGQLQQTWYL